MATATLVTIRPERVAIGLGVVVVLLVMANITLQLFRFYGGHPLGLEIAGQLYGISHNRKNFGYNMIATGEEMLEMSGIVILIYALLKYISVTMRDVSIRIGSQVQN